jgi:hypothetical protein
MHINDQQNILMIFGVDEQELNNSSRHARSACFMPVSKAERVVAHRIRMLSASRTEGEKSSVLFSPCIRRLATAYFLFAISALTSKMSFSG